MPHDYEKQRHDTIWVWNDLNAGKALPGKIELDIQFVPGENPEWSAAHIGLVEAGYRVSVYHDRRTLQATIGPIENTADEIWKHERATTAIALNHGFRPDGWGFVLHPG